MCLSMRKICSEGFFSSSNVLNVIFVTTTPCAAKDKENGRICFPEQYKSGSGVIW